MKVLLISAGRSTFGGAMWSDYDFDLPLNVAYTAAYLEQNKINTDVIDLQLPENTLFKLYEKYRLNGYDFIGVSSNLPLYKEAYLLADYLREKKYNKKIFVFGPAALYLKEKILEECKSIDYAVFGEEETTILDLIRNYKTPSEVKGVCYTSGNKFIKNKNREYVKNFDTLPFPARDKFDVKKYFPAPGKYFVLPQLTMLSSRGCDNNCLFCPNVSGNKLRCRGSENIIEEIDILINKYNAKEICFLDELFADNEEGIFKLAEEIIRRKYNIYIRICTRIDKLNEKLLKLLKRAGLYSVGVGIESGSNEILKFNNKNITVEEIESGVDLIKSVKLEIRGYFVYNLPGETKKTLIKTYNFIKKLKIDLVNIQIAYPYPGTPFRKYVEDKCAIIKEKWDKWEYSDGDDIVFLQNDLTEEFIMEYYKKTIKENFLNAKFILKWLKRIKTFHDFKYSFYQFLKMTKGRNV